MTFLITRCEWMTSGSSTTWLGECWRVYIVYANSFLAMWASMHKHFLSTLLLTLISNARCNARNRLRGELDRTVQLNLSNMTGFRVTKRLNDPIALDLDSEAGEGQNQVRGFSISFFVNSLLILYRIACICTSSLRPRSDRHCHHHHSLILYSRYMWRICPARPHPLSMSINFPQTWSRALRRVSNTRDCISETLKSVKTLKSDPNTCTWKAHVLISVSPWFWITT